MLALVSTSVLAQQGDPPYLDESVVTQSPPINDWPSCDDPRLRTDSDVSGCSTTGEAHVLDASSELSNYNDTGDPVALHNGAVSFRAVDLVVPGHCIDFEPTRR